MFILRDCVRNCEKNLCVDDTRLGPTLTLFVLASFWNCFPTFLIYLNFFAPHLVIFYFFERGDHRVLQVEQGKKLARLHTYNLSLIQYAKMFTESVPLNLYVVPDNATKKFVSFFPGGERIILIWLILQTWTIITYGKLQKFLQSTVLTVKYFVLVQIFDRKAYHWVLYFACCSN